ncbi:MAG TPA: hypothetical protein VFW33_20325, partial [Gemmataceae bacterium]|nr:hypothetical protein [Gemmataceae bacterium]
AVTAGADGLLRLWDVLTARPFGAPRLLAGGVSAVTVSPDGHRLAAGGPERTARVWDVPQPAPGDPRRLALRSEAASRAELDAEGVLRDLDDDAWNERRRLVAPDAGAE